MNNYELARAIVADVLNKVRSDEGIMYMEYVRSVEALLNKHAAQQSFAPDALPCEEEKCDKPAVLFYCEDHAP